MVKMVEVLVAMVDVVVLLVVAGVVVMVAVIVAVVVAVVGFETRAQNCCHFFFLSVGIICFRCI